MIFLSMDKQILRDALDHVKANDLNNLKILSENLPEYVPREYLFKQVYLSACTHNKSEIIEWLLGVYRRMDPVAQIGLKHTLTYGKYIIKNPPTKEWYEKYLKNFLK